MPNPLPLQWVQRILAKLTVRYGSAYLSRVAAVPEEELWLDWAETLAGYQANPPAIAWALENLPPDQPPTAGAFRELCRRAPSPRAEVEAISYATKPADPAVVAAVSGALQASPDEPNAWANALRAREIEQAENPRAWRKDQLLTGAQKRMWREALGLDPYAPAARRTIEVNGDRSESACAEWLEL